MNDVHVKYHLALEFAYKIFITLLHLRVSKDLSKTEN